MIKTKLNNKLLSNIISDKKIRVELTKESHQWFFNIYFSHYVTYPAAPFHKEMFNLTEDESIKNLVMVAFRGSAKSTIMTLSLPIWAILGKQQKKFVVIIGQTQRQAKQLLSNIKKELEANTLLRRDLGPFEEDDEWGSYSLVLPWHGARITAVSMEQTIRGMRHKQYRPDLILCDDVEDLQLVKTREGRDKIYNWITGEVIPAGDKTTRAIFIGNLLHEDSLLMRLKEKINTNELDGTFREIPLVDERENIAWTGKFPTMKDVEIERRKVGNEISFQREYLLNIVPDYDQLIHPEWIHYYDVIDDKTDQYQITLFAVDPAISLKDAADYTAILSAKVYQGEKGLKVYILPNPINKRMKFPETVDLLIEIYRSAENKSSTKILVEDVAYQKSLPQMLRQQGVPAEEVAIHGQDKYARLSMTSHLIQNGTILFPQKGVKQLISQIIHFGTEKHDDLVDAFTLLILRIMDDSSNIPGMLLYYREKAEEAKKEEGNDLAFLKNYFGLNY